MDKFEADTTGKSGQTKPNPLVLWYEKPTTQWHEALPLGNGRLGGMVFGGVSEERIKLNEDTLWSGFPRDTSNYEAINHLEEVRKLVFAGKYLEAEKIVENFMEGPWNESYQPLGDLKLTLQGVEQYTNYRRQLDLTTATTTTRFESDSRVFTRRSFISAVDQVLVVKLDCDKPGQISGTISLSSLLHGQAQAQSATKLSFKGTTPSHVEPDYVRAPNFVELAEPITYSDGETIKFEIQLEVFNEGGQTSFNENNELVIEKANSLTLHLTAANNFEGFDKQPAHSKKDPAVECEKWLAVARQPYDELYSRHLADFQNLFDRVDLSLGTEPGVDLPTDKRLQRLQAGGEDAQLYGLYFQFARYLLITSSRPGTQAANLQGIWSEDLRPPWSGNYTININTQMNYWPAEVTNLSECHTPLFDLLEELQVTGHKTAQDHYISRGWVAHHNVDIWRQAAPAGGSAMWAFWPMGGVWLCQHLWEHYAFNLDRDFLAKRAYPVMKGAALFCLDWLVDDGQGNLVTNPSTSPENRFLTKEGLPCAVSQGSTADLVMITELFNHCIEASQILETDAEFRAELETARSKIKPFRIGKFGQLQEWFEDFDELEPEHRHSSHLFGLYPGSQINRFEQPDLAQAASKSIERRLAFGGATGGWSGAWIINLLARLGDSEQAYNIFSKVLLKMSSITLLNIHPRSQGGYLFQIDGNFGAGAALAEILLQSHNGEIHLLPALPKAWSTGHFKGLKARGGFEVNLAWENGVLSEGQIYSRFERTCRIRSGGTIKEVLAGNEAVKTEQLEGGIIGFQAEAGKTYLLRG